jgi:hypothetical protein
MLIIWGFLAWCVGITLFLAVKRSRHAQMLVVPQSTAWRQLRDPAPVAPALLLVPHAVEASPIRCYDARVHKSGLRVTIGVFDSPTRTDAREWIGVRLLQDPAEVPSSNTQMTKLGDLHGMARSAWIKLTDKTGGPAGIIVNLNWYVPEVGTARVHFVSTFIESERGHEAVSLVTELCRGATFERDAGRRLQTVAIGGDPCSPPALVEDHSTFG